MLINLTLIQSNKKVIRNLQEENIKTSHSTKITLSFKNKLKLQNILIKKDLKRIKP